jgi:hypothetical protein
MKKFILLVALFALVVIAQQDQFWNSANVIEEESHIETPMHGSKSNPHDFSGIYPSIHLEFEATVTTQAPEPPKEPAVPEPPPTFFTMPVQDHWYYEIAIGIFIVIYIFQYFRGKATNDGISKAWLFRYIDLINENFSSPKPTEGASILKDGNSDYSFWASGRVNCEGFFASISLKKRYDLLTIIYEIFWGGSEDTITIQIPLAKMEPFVFAVASKKYNEENRDLLNFVSSAAEHEELRPMVIYTDSPEVTKLMLPDDVVSALKSRDFVSMHITDSASSSFYATKCIKFVFKLNRDVEKIKDLMEVIFYIVDAVASVKLKNKEQNVVAREKVSMASQQKVNREKEEIEAFKRKKEKLEKQDEKKAKKNKK